MSNLLAKANKQIIELWDLQTGKKLETNFAPEDNISAFALHKKENGLIELVAGLENGTIQIWNPEIELAALEESKQTVVVPTENEIALIPEGSDSY